MIDKATIGSVTTKRENVRTVRAAALFGSSKIVHIEHDDEVYTLRVTRNGRLILTK